jgi:hypothetical protein
MRKFLILILSCLLMSITSEGLAEKFYPSSISNLKSFGDFENIYQEIYDDVNVEDDELVLNRVAEHNFQKNFGHNFTQEEVVSLCDLNVPGVYAAKKEIVSQNYQIDTSLKIRNLCNTEREFLRFENNLERRTGMMSIFADETLSNSSFDIIEDWNQIDKLLHGEFYKPTKPTFPKLVLKKSTDNYDSEKECWQDERKESEIPGCDNFQIEEYSLTDSSLSGIFNNLIELALTELTSRSLVAQKTTHYLFEVSNCFSDGDCSPSDPGDFNATDSSVNFPTSDDPEVHKPDNGDMTSPFEADEKKILVTARCFALSDEKDTSVGMANSVNCAETRATEFDNTLQNYRTKTDSEVFTNHESRIYPELSRVTQIFDLFVIETNKFVKIMNDLRPKPQLH